MTVPMKRLLAHAWRLLNLPKDIQLFVMRMMNDEFLVGVTGVILNKDDEILFVKHTYRQTQWSLPGGYLKKGEHPKKGLEREILEETGLHVKVIKIVRTWHDRSNARLDISGYGVLIGGKFRPSEEVTKHAFFPFEKIPPKIAHKQKKLVEKVLKKEKSFLFHKMQFLRPWYALVHQFSKKR